MKQPQLGREAIAQWQADIQKNIYKNDLDLIHSFHNLPSQLQKELETFGAIVPTQLEECVARNHTNLPSLEAYNSRGDRIDHIMHHPAYIAAGDLIYGTKLLEKIAHPGGLAAGLSLFFLASQAGEAGHNCPIACSAGILRVLEKAADFPNKNHYREKLISPSFQTNFTGAQFLTEIQGGSDVGLNAVYAEQENNMWRIYGEKWFCSNANADLIFITARYDETISGTRGLGLFLVPATWNNTHNHYTLRRLKEKLGTRTMATAEIDFNGAYAYPIGNLETSFHLVMENVLHISRLFNTVCVLGMARRAYTIARSYAQHRHAFSQAIIHYPLVQENLARIKAENNAMLAAIFATIRLQDQIDLQTKPDKKSQLLLRILTNIQKYLSAKWSVEHIHHALDVLAGNGTIETFSPLPRLLRDSIVCENWEGTHNVLRMQILKDIQKYQIDEIFCAHLHEEIKKINTSSSALTLLQTQLQTLEQKLKDFRQCDPALQSLQIRLVVDAMAILYCGVQLLREALDQKEKTGRTSKLDCFSYFGLLHLNTEKINYDKNYLALIARIVEN